MNKVLDLAQSGSNSATIFGATRNRTTDRVGGVKATGGDSFVSGFVRENFISSAYLSRDTIATREEFEAARDEGFNPYQYLSEVHGEDSLSDVSSFIDAGLFEGARSERHAEAILTSLRRELKDQQAAAENGFSGFLGNAAGAILDPTIFIPWVGPAAKLGAAGRVGVGVGNGVLQSSVSEIGLQSVQEARTLNESIINIGVGAALGGGLGFFMPTTYPGSTLHPKHPDNPLRPGASAQSPITYRNAYGEADELTPDDLKVLEESADDMRSVGAAEVDGRFTDEDLELARNSTLTRSAKASRAVGDFFFSKTIAGRMARASVPEARRLGLELMDPGGVLFKGHLKGKALAPAAETIKDHTMSRVGTLFGQLQGSVIEINRTLKPLPGKSKVSEADVMNLTQRVLTNVNHDDIVSDLAQRYGPEGADRILAVAKNNAELIHVENDFFEQALIKNGDLFDEAVAAELTQKLKATREEIKGADEDSLPALRKQRDRLVRELNSETSKPRPLGREYGHAQLWNQDSIVFDMEGYRSFLRRVLLKNPDETFLTEQGMTRADLDELAASDPEAYDSFLSLWAGDAQLHRQAVAKAELAKRTRELEGAEGVLAESLRRAGVLRRDEGRLTLSAARKKRDKIAAEASEVRALKREEAADSRGLEFPGLGSETKRAKKRRELAQERLRSVEEALKEVEALKAMVSKMTREDKESFKKTKKEANKANRAAKRAAKSTPLDEMIDDIIDAVTKTGTMSVDSVRRVLETSDRTTGRVKSRALHLTPEERLEAIEAGYLRSDLPSVLYSQYDQVAAHLALTEALGIGKGRAYKSWADRLKAFDVAYDQAIAEAPDVATKNRLSSERNILREDFIEARDRIRGPVQHHDGTTHGWGRWVGAKLRAVTFSRFGGSFLVSSMTDLATAHLRHGGTGRGLMKAMRSSYRQLAELRKSGLPRSDIEAFVLSHEMGMGPAAWQRRYGVDDVTHGKYGAHGIGYGRTRAVTGAVDRATGKATEVVATLSGLPLWNRYWKITASNLMIRRIDELTQRLDNLTDLEKADLASTGIGMSDAAKIRRQIDRHGSRQPDGSLDPNTDLWDLDTRRVFLMAIQRDMERAIHTPGVGDTPRLMSHWVFKLLLQFQTFAFTFMNRYIYPAMQRSALGDRTAMTSGGVLLASAAFVMVLKDALAGRDIGDRLEGENWGSTAYEIVDRSGLMGWTFPYVGAATKALGFGGPGRLAQQTAFEGLLGVNSSLLGDTGRAVVAVQNLDDDAASKVMSLAPFGSVARSVGNILME